MRRLLLALPLAALLAPPAPAATLLRLDGVGPLELGMARSLALGTGWLSDRRSGCPLGGRPYPIGYSLDGPVAPPAIRGQAEFVDGRLRTLTFAKGVRTATGVVPGRTTWRKMVVRYRKAGFRVSARYDEVFRGTFVQVKRRGELVMVGFAERKVVASLGIPFIPLCE